MQLITLSISVLPILGVGYWLTAGGGIDAALFATVTVALFISIAVAFVRMALSAMLAFKHVAALDTLESVIRSLGWLVVAWMFPTAMGLALAGLATSAVAAVMALIFLTAIIRRHGAQPGVEEGETAASGVAQMLKDSISFLALSAGTRAYQTLPIILIGQLFGFGITGVIGAFAKIVEFVSLPFTILGNALMVRAQEIKNGGIRAVNRYWDLLFRLSIIALICAWSFWFVSADAARIMLPREENAAHLFSMMTLLIFLRSVSDLFAPASDYVGGLKGRIVFLFACAVLQLPAIWVAGLIFGMEGTVAAMVASYGIVVIGYVLIAKKVFFGEKAYEPAKDIFVGFAVAILLSAAASAIAAEKIAGVLVYLSAILGFFMAIPLLRRQYATWKLLRFDFMEY